MKAGKRGKDDLALAVPPAGKKALKSEDELKRAGKVLKKRRKALDALASAAEASDLDAMEAATEKHAKALQSVELVTRHFLGKLDVTQVLVSHLENGGEAAFAKNKVLTLHVALVDRESGAFRYYAVNKGRKEDLPTNYDGLVAILTKNVFDGVGEVDAPST